MLTSPLNISVSSYIDPLKFRLHIWENPAFSYPTIFMPYFRQSHDSEPNRIPFHAHPNTAFGCVRVVPEMPSPSLYRQNVIKPALNPSAAVSQELATNNRKELAREFRFVLDCGGNQRPVVNILWNKLVIGLHWGAQIAW